jgi:Ca2+-binding RTX toxin-like protein
MAKLDPRQKPLWANIDGTASGETLDGTNVQDIINGFGGDDTLNGLDGDDYLVGGTGNDTMNGGLGNDTMYVDAVGDIVNEAAGQGNDRVATEVSYTNLTGNEIANTIIGNNGVNILDGGAGADVMIGVGSDDTYYVDNVGDVVVEDVGGGVDRVSTLVSYVLSSGASVDILEVLDQNSS